jgi:hypothetical protein
MKRILASIGLCLCHLLGSAQVNDKGTFHAAVGIAGGAHATTYEQHFLITTTTEDGAATVTYPIELGFGLARVFSLGLLLEPGTYLDSLATESNRLLTLAIQPRFYLVNHDRFAWMASLQLGTSALRYQVEEGAIRYSSNYRGGHFGLSTGLGMYFGERVGIDLHLRYMATSMDIKDHEVNGQQVDLALWSANLSTRGVAVQASLAFKF